MQPIEIRPPSRAPSPAHSAAEFGETCASVTAAVASRPNFRPRPAPACRNGHSGARCTVERAVSARVTRHRREGRVPANPRLCTGGFACRAGAPPLQRSTSAPPGSPRAPPRRRPRPAADSGRGEQAVRKERAAGPFANLRPRVDTAAFAQTAATVAAGAQGPAARLSAGRWGGDYLYKFGPTALRVRVLPRQRENVAVRAGAQGGEAQGRPAAGAVSHRRRRLQYLKGARDGAGGSISGGP